MRAEQKGEQRDMVREEQVPTLEIQGQKYYGLSGIAEYIVDMGLGDRPPYPFVALGLKSLEDYQDRHGRIEKDD